MKMIIGVIVAVAVIGAGAYYFMNSSTGQSVTDTTQLAEGEGDNVSGGAYSGSLAQLSARGGNWKCSIETSAAGSISSGTVYVSGNRMRGEFSSTVAGAGTMQSYMVNDGEYTYTWSSAAPQGMKMKMPVGGDGAVAPTSPSGQGANLNEAYSYNCAPWSVEASLLAPPTNISFMEFALP